jgi:hypothetical protein
VFRTPDYFVLQVRPEIIEIITVTSHTHDQITVFFWVLLGITQGIGRHYIELNVMTVKPEVTSNQLTDFDNAFFIFEKGRGKLLVEQSTSGPYMIHFGHGFND